MICWIKGPIKVGTPVCFRYVDIISVDRAGPVHLGMLFHDHLELEQLLGQLRAKHFTLVS